VTGFASREPVIYLHPSSGLFFERFLDQPAGSIHYLIADPTGHTRSELTNKVAFTNEVFWQHRWTNALEILARQTNPKIPSAFPLLQPLHLTSEQNFTATTLGAIHAKSLNAWGVAQQRRGRWPEAQVWFQRALELNSANLSARINLLYNERYQRGDRTRLDAASLQRQFPDLFTNHDKWPEVLNADGPVDEPTFLFRTAGVMQAGGNTRQAADDFVRCIELAPDWPAPKLRLARSSLYLGDFAGALALSDRVLAASRQLSASGLADLLYCRATALAGLGRTNDAAACAENFIRQYREHNEVLSVAADFDAQSRQFEKELALLDELLRRVPDRPEWLVKKGLAELQLEKYDAAIATLTRALALTPSDNEARAVRALACLGADQLEAARSDYQELLKTPGTAPNASFGLGAIAWRQRDTNAAIQWYQQYLSNSLPDSPQHLVAAERLKQLKSTRAR
jgi:tetratricopeptide (TPR) repeat protein